MHKKGKWLTTSKIWLLIILISYLILGFAYSIVIPLAETPDESEHFRYMQSIALSGQLPVMQPEREANVTIEAHQPPLYYLLGAAAFANYDLDPQDNPQDNPCFSFEPDDPGRKNAYLHITDEWPPQRDLYIAFYMMRWASILMGVGTVILAYILGRQAIPSIAWFGTAVAALLAFNPQFIFITSSVNNDVPTTLLGAAIVVLSINAINRKSWISFILLAIASGLGMLTKFALIAFWPLAFLAAGWSSIQLSQSPIQIKVRWSDLIRRFSIVFFLPLIIAGWWYWRNYQLYGDPLMWDVTLAAKGSVIARTTPFILTDLLQFISLHFQSFWIWFGWLNIKAPDWVYVVLLVVTLVTAAGLVRWLVKRNVPVAMTALAINGIAILAIYASLLQYIQTINWTGYQGRLAFAAAASIAVFFALGLVALGGRKLAIGVGFGLGILSIAAIVTLLWPAYPQAQVYQLERELTRTCARFAEGIQVEAVDTGDSVLPGGVLPVTIFGYGLDDSDAPQTMALFLEGAEGRQIGQATAVLQWQAGQAVEAGFELSIEEDALPSRALLSLAMLDENGNYQPASSATGRELSLPLPLDTVKVSQGQDNIHAPQFESGANFSQKLKLIGYDLYEPEKGQLLITLYWQAIDRMDVDYTTFVHALEESGQLIAQDDGQPRAGVYPTSVWDKEEIVAEVKILDLSAANEEDEITLVTGVYLLGSLQRLPVQDADGLLQANDQLILDSIEP